MAECLSAEDERPVSLFAEENRRSDDKNKANGNELSYDTKRSADTVVTERVKSPKVTVDSDASTNKEIRPPKAADSANTTTTSASTANISNAQSPEAKKEEQPKLETAPIKSPKTVSIKSSDKPAEAKDKPKYTLGNLINSLIAKNAPAEEDLENQLVFKSNFNNDLGNKQPKAQEQAKQDQLKNSDTEASSTTNNSNTTPTKSNNFVLQGYLSDSDSIYSSPSESNTPSSEDESSKKSQTSTNNQNENSSVNSSKNNRSHSGGSYSDCYSDSPGSIDRNETSNNGDGAISREQRSDSATKKLLLQRQSPEKPGEGLKRRSSDAEQMSRRETASHDPYMFLARLKKPRLGADDTAAVADSNMSMIMQPWKITNGSLDNIIEQEFILDNIQGQDSSSIAKKLMRGSLFDESQQSQRSVTPNDSQQQNSKQGPSKPVNNNSHNEPERSTPTPTKLHNRGSPLSFHPQQQPVNKKSPSPSSTSSSGMPTLEKAIKNIITKTMKDIKPPNTNNAASSPTSPQGLMGGLMEKHPHPRNEPHPNNNNVGNNYNQLKRPKQLKDRHPEIMFSFLSKSHPIPAQQQATSSQQQQNSELISLTRSYGRPARHIPSSSVPSKTSPQSAHGPPSQQTSPGGYLPSSTKNSLVNMDKLVSLSPQLLANITQQEKLWSGQADSHSPNQQSLPAHLSRQKQLKGFEQIQQNNGSRSIGRAHSPCSRGGNGHPIMLLSPPMIRNSPSASNNNPKLSPSSQNPMGPHDGLTQAQMNSIMKEAASASLNSSAAIQQQLQQQHSSSQLPGLQQHPTHSTSVANSVAAAAMAYLPLLSNNPNNLTELIEAINHDSSFGKNMYLQSAQARNIGGPQAPPRSPSHNSLHLPPHSFPHPSLLMSQLAAANGSSAINPYHHPPTPISPSSTQLQAEREPPGFHPAHFQPHFGPKSYPASEMQSLFHGQQQQEQNWDHPPMERSHSINGMNTSIRFYEAQLLAQLQQQQQQQQQRQHHNNQHQLNKQSAKPSQQSSSQPHQSFKKRLLSSIEDIPQVVGVVGSGGNEYEPSSQMTGLASHLSPQLIQQHPLNELSNSHSRQKSSSHHK